MKRKPVFLRTVMKEVHGKMVEVKIFGEIDPNPIFSIGKMIDNVGEVTVEQLKEINKMKAEHDVKLSEVEPEDGDNTYYHPNDEFLDTVTENAIAAEEEYEAETDESFKPLDEMLEEL